MTRSTRTIRPRGPLFTQLGWFIQLRWIAMVTLLIGAIIERRINWFGGRAGCFFAVAGVIFAYNSTLQLFLPRVRTSRVLRRLALAQLMLDMIALTALVIWTGGARSPLMPFFVFHMVFASLLLPQVAAYVSAAVACGLITSGLILSHNWPEMRVDHVAITGMQITLVLTVMLTNRITRDLRAHRKRLARQNRRMTALDAQLRRQQQALVQHEKMVALGRMAAGVTHEIANPLASIDSILQLAQRRPERMKPDTVETLRAQVQRINQIIQQMRVFSHPTQIQLRTMPLKEVIEQALEMVRFDRRIKNVEVRREFDARAGSVDMSPQALQQVLVNLIINALDAMAKVEQPVLTIRTQRREGWCVVEVTDNGHGVDPQHMPRLFEPFFTTKPVGQGTGLGLSISYSLMQKQGGSISVRSKSAEGATFTLRLPVCEPSRRQEAPVTSISGTENPSL